MCWRSCTARSRCHRTYRSSQRWGYNNRMHSGPRTHWRFPHVHCPVPLSRKLLATRQEQRRLFSHVGREDSAPERRVSGLHPQSLEAMRNVFTAVIERDDAWFIAYSP